LGDLHAKIGKEEVYQNVAGKHETSNRNREWACEYTIANNMKIIGTDYQHKRIHKGTWISPDDNTLNLKWIRTQNKIAKQAKWNKNNLQDPARLKLCTTCLYNKLKGKDVQKNIKEEWTHIRKTVIQTQNTSNRN
jgi:hypothetical protein